jgi:polysaccharide biosynthesis protein PelE
MKVFYILLKSALLALALGFEIYALQLILNESVSRQSLVSALLTHLFASVLGAGVLPKSMMLNLPDPLVARLKAYFLFFVIIFYMPVLGLIGLCLAVPFKALHSHKREKPNSFMHTSKIRDFPSESAVDGGPAVNLHSVNDLYRSRSSDRRLQAVYATLKLKDRDAIPLLRTALADPVDDIRLLAYTLLDRKEYRLSKHIDSTKQELEKKENSGRKQLYRQIGSCYWELAHLGLVQGEAKNHVLGIAYKYIELGLEYSPEDCGLRFQYAQILLRLGKYQMAFEQFKKAEILGIEHLSLLTYYAEIAFHNRRYQEVKQLMTAIELPAAYPLLTTTARFWQMRANATATEIR